MSEQTDSVTIDTEYVSSCALCGSSSSELALADCSDTRYGLPGRFSLVRCKQCGLVYLNPRPIGESLASYYPQEYAPHQPGRKPQSRSSLSTRISQNLQRAASQRYYPVPQNHRPTPAGWSMLAPLYSTFFKATILPSPRGIATALDVGCGIGKLLVDLEALGWTVSGVETNAKAASYARQELNLDVITGELTDAGYPDHSFALVTLMHVLEHVSKPTGLLEEISRILVPGGLLLLMLPNIESLEFKLFGKDWYSLDIPRHLSHFSPKTLQYAVQSTDLVVRRIVSQPNSYSLAHSLLRKFGERDSRTGKYQLPGLSCSLLYPMAMMLAWFNVSGDMFIHVSKID